MQIKSLVLAALAAICVSAHSRRQAEGDEKPFGCSTPPPTEAQLAVAAQLAEQEAIEGPNVTLARRQSGITVDVYFHVVAASTSVSDGYVTDTMLTNQLAVMNTDYAPHGISFVLKGTDRTVNSNWASDGNELAMKKSLRKGDYKTLNIYFQKALTDDALGYCYFPDDVTTNSNDFYYDGCSIDASTVPGGSATGYNLGGTVIHEVGHWFGLYHTFQGNSCSGSGDLISDTPQQLSYTTGCPVGRDSCPNAAGVDPIHNYMDYSTDICYEEFTAGQETRIYSQWSQYRA